MIIRHLLRIFAFMKKIWLHIKAFCRLLRRYISPVFIAMFVLAFILWYISKLSYTYTTDFKVKVRVDGRRIEVPCVVEGKGTNLVGYSLYASRRINIPLSELAYDTVAVIRPSAVEGAAADTLRRIKINPASLRDAISVRFSDLKIRSVGEVPDMNIEEER